MLMYLVKSVLRAPVPAYCTEQASALSAHTKKDGINLQVSKCINIFENDAATNKMLKKDNAPSSILNRELDSLIEG